MKTLLFIWSLVIGHCLAGPFFFGQQAALSATPAAFSPADISNLSMWLVAGDISGNDGDAVQTWPARSPTSISPTQSTVASRPTLQTLEINGKHAVLSDGVDDFMTFTPISSSGSWTIITVQKRTSSGSLGGVVGNTNASLTKPPYSALEYGALSRVYIGSRTDQKYATIPSHAWHVITSQDASGTLGLWVDGSAQSLTAAADSGAFDFSVLFGRGNERWAVYVAEVLVYTKTLNAIERGQVEAYLKSRYATP